MKKLLLIVLSLSLLAPAAALAETPCSAIGTMIQDGDHKSVVLETCGEPGYKENIGEKIIRKTN